MLSFLEDCINSDTIPTQTNEELNNELEKFGYQRLKTFYMFGAKSRLPIRLIYSLLDAQNIFVYTDRVVSTTDEFRSTINPESFHPHVLLKTVSYRNFSYETYKTELATLYDFNENLNSDMNNRFNIQFFGISKDGSTYLFISTHPATRAFVKAQLGAVLLTLATLRNKHLITLNENQNRLLDELSAISKDYLSHEYTDSYCRAFANAIINYTNTLNMFKMDYAKKLLELIVSAAKSRKETLQTRIDQENYTISKLQNQLAKVISELQDNLLTMTYYKACEDEKQKKADQLLNVLTTYPSVHHFKVNHEYIYIYITKDLKINSKEDLEAILDNLLEECDLTETDTKVMTSLLKKVFIEEKYALRTFACISFNPLTNAYSAKQEETLDAEHCRHPHLMRYNCFGANAQIITDCLIEQDYEAVLEQMLHAVQFVNWSDNPVMSYLIQQILQEYDKPFFKDYETEETFSYKKYKEEIYAATE